MFRSIRINTLSLALALLGSFIGTANRTQAQTYQIDCAILLCLSGGWPASVPCARARAEFIRRITPWPIEPPLQIWRCPMGASYQPMPPTDDIHSLYDIVFADQRRPKPMFTPVTETLRSENAVMNLAASKLGKIPEGFALQFVNDRADINISGPEFNFVRSIRVYDIRYARQQPTRGDCMRSATVYVGTYGQQGDFSWARSALDALPPSHTGVELWGIGCPHINHRSVFVDWYDYEGQYGSEQVDY